MNTFEELETARLIAKKWNKNYFEEILSLYQNATIMELSGGIMSESEIREMISKNLIQWEKIKLGRWIWFERLTNQFIGSAGFHESKVENERLIELGFMLMPQFWNKGYGTEMVRTCLEIAFKMVKANRIAACTHTANKASQQILEKVGFKLHQKILDAGEENLLYIFK